MADAQLSDSSHPALTAGVLRILETVLRAETVEPAGSFYDYGGTSLQAMRVCIDIQRELGVEIAPEILLECDTLADFAKSVAALNDE